MNTELDIEEDWLILSGVALEDGDLKIAVEGKSQAYFVSFSEVKGHMVTEEVFSTFSFQDMISEQYGFIKVVPQINSPCEKLFHYTAICPDAGLKYYQLFCRDHVVQVITAKSPTIEKIIA